MIKVFHKIIQPSQHLQLFIKDYTLFHFQSDQHDIIPEKPFPANTEQCLVFYLQGFVTAIEAKAATAFVYPKIAVNGSQLSRFNFHISNRFLMLSVQFQPAVLSKFLRSPLTDFTNVRIDAEAILNPGIREVYEKMCNAESYEKIIGLIETYLWERITGLKIDFQPIDAVARIIAEKPNALSIEKLAADACLSISQFERRFVQQTGITPKLFIRINRFYNAYKMKQQYPDADWLSIALQTGYYDYQHLVKDFRQFSNSSPASLLLAQANSPDKFTMGF